MNLARDPWIPVVRKNRQRAIIRPAEITRDFGANPVVEVDATRAPWNGALTEFLIALFQTAIFPEDGREWRRAWHEPPSPSQLDAALAPLADRFELAGPGPRFMQDPSLASSDEKSMLPIRKLMVDGVSAERELHNADLFQKRDAVGAICRGCAAAALWDLQAHAPQGSRGYYTSLRGGGPVSAIVCGVTLWETVWSNVVEIFRLGMSGRPDPDVFLPWRWHRNGRVRASEECPLHVYWGMPRRIWLLEEDGPDLCDLCGVVGSPLVRNYLTYRGGLQYSETEWVHPLSPYLLEKSGWLVRRTDETVAGYRDWLGVLFDTPHADGRPSLAVRSRVERNLPGEPWRIWAFGYAAEMAAIRTWHEGRMPVVSAEPRAARAMTDVVVAMVVLSQRAVEELEKAIEDAWRAPGRPRIASSAKALAEGLWARTEPKFIESVRRVLCPAPPAEIEGIKDEWMFFVRKTAIAIYEAATPPGRSDLEWSCRLRHRLARRLGSRNAATLKTLRFGEWRLEHDRVDAYA